MRKWIIGGVFLIMIGFVIVMATRKPHPIRLTLIPDSHVVIHGEETGNLYIHLFINDRHPYMADMTWIRETYLENGDNRIPITLESIVCQREVKILEDSFYDFSYLFTIDFPQELLFDEVWLVFAFSFQDNIRVSIGSLSYYHRPPLDENLVRVTHIKGVFNKGTLQPLVGVLLELDGDEILTITEFEILNHRVTLEEVILLEDYLDTNEEYLALLSNHTFTSSFPIKIDNPKILLIPLKHLSNYPIGELAFRMILTNDSITSTQIIDSFCFYRDAIQMVDVHQLVFYEFDLYQ
jgi:hypothetical protein